MVLFTNGVTVCTSPYTQSIPCLHISMRVGKTSQLLKGKILWGSRVSLGSHPLTPYPDSQVRGLFLHKYNHHTSIPRDSGNVTPQTVNPLTVRGFHQTPFRAYNFLTLITLHKNQTHLPRDSQWYDDHNQQGFGVWEKKIIWRWPYLMNVITPLFKGAVLNDDISCLGPCWSLFWPNSFIPPYLLIL